MTGTFIVKVQVPLATSEEVPAALLYNKDRHVQAMVPVTDELLASMAGEKKKFFYARMVGTIINIDGEAPCQDW